MPEKDVSREHSFKVLSLVLIVTIRSSFTVSRIALVKPSKARSIQDLLIRMAQSGQVRQKITEHQLIGLLDQVEGQGQGAGGASGGPGKITVSIHKLRLMQCFNRSSPSHTLQYTRKKTLSDDDDDFDL